MNIEELYRQDLRQLRKQHKAISSKRQIVHHKILGKNQCFLEDNRTDVEKRDQRIIAEMVSSTEYALFWIQTGNEQPYDKPSRSSLPKHKRDQLWASMDDLIQLRVGKDLAAEVWNNYERKNALDMQKEERLAQTKEVISTLSPREQELFHLRYAAMLSESEAAEKMGVELGTVKAMAQRIREKIERYFKIGYQMSLF